MVWKLSAFRRAAWASLFRLLGSGSFTLTFNFDTSRAEPGYFTPNYPDNLANGFLTTPSVGSAYFQPDGGVSLRAGDYYARDSASAGSTSQFASSRVLGRGGFYQSPTISMSASHPDIPNSILVPFEIESDIPIGTGSATFFYENTFLGGGAASYSLTAYTIEVAITGVTAVPEPSTLAMLLIGFAGMGFAA
jgi:hypothetical protein